MANNKARLRQLETVIRRQAAASNAIDPVLADPVEFRNRLLIDRDGTPTPFGPNLDPWQAEDFAALDPGWQKAMGLPVEDDHSYQRAWLERCRGGSKTTDIAVMVSHALAFAPRQISGIACAADADQAALVRRSLEKLLQLNPWLAAVLEAKQWKVTNVRTGSELTVISSDAATSFGALPDFVIADELTHWSEGRGQELFVSIISAVAKRRNALLVIITNAGFQESWQAKLRENVIKDRSWCFHSVDTPASWISEDHLQEQRRLLPDLAFRRLWCNEWTSGTGDALRSEDVEAAVTLSGPTLAPEPGWSYFAGLDLGISHDHSALVLLGLERTSRRLKLAQVHSWAPPARGGKIDLEQVQDAALEVHRLFHPLLYCDPFQAELLGQQLQRRGVRIEMVSFVGNVLQEMASALLESFTSHTIDLFRSESLLADLRRLKLTERPSGWRLDAERTSSGHCDRATALALAVLAAKRSPQSRRLQMWTGSDVEQQMEQAEKAKGEYKPSFHERMTNNPFAWRTYR